MKKIVHCLTLALAILVLVVSGCAQKVDVEAERATLRNADAEWSNVTGAKDVDGFVAAFAENGSILPPNTPILTGSEAIRQWASEMVANPGFALGWQPTTVEVSTAGDLGYTVGTYELTLQDVQGNPLTDRGKYVTVWKKQPDGKWKVVADIFNSDLPAPTADLSESDEAVADEWKPPKNPDPQKILSEARADARAERYEDALAKHVWFHRNALKHEQALYGVRLSFALGYWHELGKAYPPALVKLKEIRDEATKNVTNGKHVRESFHDLAAINRTVGEESRTKEIFVLLDAQNADAAKEVFGLAQSALINSKDYKLCGKYIDPIRSFPRIIESFRENKRLAKDPRFGVEHLGFANKKFTNDAATLIALLAVNGRKAEAEEIAGDAKKEWNNASFHAEIDKALQGKIPKPWP